MNPAFPQREPSPGGEIVIADEQGRRFYDELRYAPARRAGDFVYVSGVVIARDPDGERTLAAFARSMRTAFSRIAAMLDAFDLGFDDVVMMNSFHDWSAPEFGGERGAQFEAFARLKAEIMATARPAWTAVGTSGLVSEDYIVEVQMIAYAPQRAAEGA